MWGARAGAILALLAAVLVAPGLAFPAGAAGAMATGSGPFQGAMHAPAPAPLAAATGRAPHAVPHRAEPRAGVHVTTFVVATLTDSPLASALSKSCHDAATGACSLRAAVAAANNLAKPVVIKLGAHAYQLTDVSAAQLKIQNPGGTTIEGVSKTGTRVIVPGGDVYQAIEVLPAASVGSAGVIEDLTISGGNATLGGGILVQGTNAALVLDNVLVTHNTATDGGGVACSNANLWMTGSSVSANTATADGGGLNTYWCNSFLSHDVISSNLATIGAGTQYGGGIYNDYGNFQLIDSTVQGNAVGNASFPGYGGGIADQYSGDTIVGSNIVHNFAFFSGWGGGLYADYATVDATASSISYNLTTGNTGAGGGVADEFSQVELHKTTLLDNATQSTSSLDGGGGIYVYGSASDALLVVDSGSSITDNSTSGIVAYETTGGLHIDVSNTTIKGNSSSLNGAAGIFFNGQLDGGASIVLAGDSFLGNHAAGVDSAGAVLVYGGQDASVSLDAVGCTVKGNVASGANGTGGISAITMADASATARIEGSTIEGNHAPQTGRGGGVAAWSFGTTSDTGLFLVRDTIAGNSAGSAVALRAGQGGGVYTGEYSTLHVEGSRITSNTALGTGIYNGAGGGIFDGSFIGGEVIGSIVSGNVAEGSAGAGGGIYAYPEYGGFNVRNSTIAGNRAIQGGGVYVYEYQLTVAGSTIEGNVAGTAATNGAGGGIFSYASVVTIFNSTLTQNRAMSSHSTAGHGGAVFMNFEPISLYFATVAGNAAQFGAGIDTESSFGTLRDSIVVGNHTAPTSKTEADCHASVHSVVLVSIGGNVLSRANCVAALAPGDVVTAKPGLLALAANGGPTKTMAIVHTSPAVGAARGDCLATDQRGVARPTKGICDAGAYELAATKAHR
jgi:hypothetical protein